MATKQSPKPTKSSKSTAVVPWMEEMKQAAAKVKIAENLTSFAKKISIRSGILSVDGTPIDGNNLDVVVIAAVHARGLYEGRFEPDTPTVPVCYAYGDHTADDPSEDMVPHEDSENKQHHECATCENNVMGSADTGRGKACKETRRLAIITPDALESADEMEAAEIRKLSVPVTSIKNWQKYASGVANDFERPYYGAICNLKVVPDPRTQFQVLFTFRELIEFEQAVYEALKKRIEEAYAVMTQPMPKQADLQQVAKPMKPVGRIAQKAVAKKVVAKQATKIPPPPAKAKKKF